jgi:hypothetical protein
MGLDWDPLPRARPGHEAAFDELVERMVRDGNDCALDEHPEIWQPVFETLGAPRVGIDAAADEWLRAKVAPEKFDEVHRQMKGYYVLDLLPPCDGFPLYSNHSVSPDLGRYAFRAQFLKDVEDVLGGELFELAFTFMNAAAHQRYGERLLETARIFARANKVEHVEHVGHTEADAFEDNTPASRGHILFAAAKWCLYWAARGHGLAPWF